MNGAPDWQDGECCFRCRTQFSLVARKHHCRNCGNIFCAKCSSQQIPLPNLNIEKNVRVCDSCYEKLSSKNADPLDLAIDKHPETAQAKIKVSSKPSNGQSKVSSSTSNKPAANASAPSEQELKEEEELQLALALSLSEAPAKISFPDCRQFEEKPSSISTSNNHLDSHNASNSYSNPLDSSTGVNSINMNSSLTATSTVTTTNVTSTATTQPNVTIYPEPNLSTPEKQQPITHIQPQYQQEPNIILDRDQELFRFVAEVQSTAEVFTNRINSNKARNRPIADDTAIQGLFLKLTNMHATLLEYIKVHDEERSGFESIQDKLSQITDARAALDALREEHQDRIRQEAAEAERQRQSQLASKLEMMRQKKSQMMQYQREVALQRIQAQEMMLRQPQGQQQPSITTTTSSQQVPQLPNTLPHNTNILQGTNSQDFPILQEQQQQQLIAYQPQPTVQQQQYQQPVSSTFQQPSFQQQGLPSMQQYIPNISNHCSVQQTVVPPAPKLEDEAPLISFDD